VDGTSADMNHDRPGEGRTDPERIDRLFAELDRVADELMLDELEAALRRARQALGVDP
jgi:hypothetical protein